MAYSKLRGARKNKKDKKEEEANIAEQDAFQEQGQKVVDQLLAHPYFISGTVFAIIAVVIIGLIISSKIKGGNDELAYEFSNSIAMFDNKEEGEDKYKKSIELFSKIIETQAGSIKAHFNLKEFDKAIEAFKKAKTMAELDEKLIFSAYEGEALCYLEKKEFDKAIELWKEWLNKTSDFYKDYALYYIGFSLEKSGKKKDALVYYKRLKDEFPKSTLITKIIDKLPAEKIELPKDLETKN